MSSMIKRSERDGVIQLRMAHGKASALDLEFLEAMVRCFEEEREQTSGPIVLTGSGSIFSAGVDLFRILDGGRDYIERFLPALDAALLAIFNFPRPVIAAINGHAVAGGLIVACACDQRFAVDAKATLGVPELRVGVPFPLAALEMLRRCLPAHRIEEIIYRGRMHSPQEALAIGLVQELYPADDLNSRAFAAAQELASIPPSSFAATKQLLQAPTRERLERQLESGRAQMIELWSGAEIQNAIRAYVEKTIPKR